MSTVSECVQWDQKYRRVWSADAGKHVMMKYLRLNLIDLYNNHMNSVDLADQLRNCYRMNHWFRNRKWWWAIFQWALGVAATNAYIMYERIYEEEAKNKKAMPRKWNHLEFLVELIYDFMGWASDDVKIDVEDEDDSPVSSNTRSSAASSVATSVVASEPTWTYNFATDQGRQICFEKPPETINVTRMSNTYFEIRNDGKFHPYLATVHKSAYCQFCKYKYNHLYSPAQKKANKVMFNNRCSIKRCLVCSVNLCDYCFSEWHGCGFSKMNRMFNP